MGNHISDKDETVAKMMMHCCLPVLLYFASLYCQFYKLHRGINTRLIWYNRTIDFGTIAFNPKIFCFVFINFRWNQTSDNPLNADRTVALHAYIFVCIYERFTRVHTCRRRLIYSNNMFVSCCCCCWPRTLSQLKEQYENSGKEVEWNIRRKWCLKTVQGFCQKGWTDYRRKINTHLVCSCRDHSSKGSRTNQPRTLSAIAQDYRPLR